jgi:hypothetical protein
MTTLKKLAIALLVLAFAAGAYLRHSEALPASHGPLAAVVVEDTARRTPQVGAVLTDPDVLAYVRQANIAWHVVDRSAAGPDLAEVQFALEAAKTAPLPALVLREGEGKPQVRPLPDAKTLLALLRTQAPSPRP